MLRFVLVIIEQLLHLLFEKVHFGKGKATLKTTRDLTMVIVLELRGGIRSKILIREKCEKWWAAEFMEGAFKGCATASISDLAQLNLSLHS